MKTIKIRMFVLTIFALFTMYSFAQEKNVKKQVSENKISIKEMVDKDFVPVSMSEKLFSSGAVLSRGSEEEDAMSYSPAESNSKDIYKGSLANNKFEGKGILIKVNGDKYTGEFKEGLFNGNGKYVWSDSSKYEGDWKNNKMSGYGIFIDNRGNRYVGEWLDNMKNGNGTQTLANGTKFAGQWKNNFLDGKVIMTKANGDKFDGVWKVGGANGNGTYTFVNGCKYAGEWKNGTMEGKGTLTTKNGKKYTGIWKENELIKKL